MACASGGDACKGPEIGDDANGGNAVGGGSLVTQSVIARTTVPQAVLTRSVLMQRGRDAISGGPVVVTRAG